MTSTILALVVVVAGLIVWLATRTMRNAARRGTSVRHGDTSDFSQDQLLLIKNLVGKELDEIEKKTQQLIDDSAHRGTKVSTAGVLKPVEELKAEYLRSGQDEAAREVERIINEFRNRHGPEISIDEAYRLMKELERKHRE